jgi:hypothetical protein
VPKVGHEEKTYLDYYLLEKKCAESYAADKTEIVGNEPY